MNKNNVYQFPGDGKVTPEEVIESLDRVKDQIELVTCVVKFKDNSEYEGATSIVFNGMSDRDMLWLRFCFEDRFKPSIKEI